MGSNILECEYFNNKQMQCEFENRQQNELSCLYLNIRSLVNNFDSLNHFLASFKVKPDIIALAETKLTEKVNLNANVDIDGYCFEHRKSKTHFGGVGLYISNQIDYSLREDLDLTEKGCDSESLFIDINTRSKKKHVIGIVYRHPQQNFKNFQNEFEKVLQKLNDKRTSFKILGDINIDYLRASKTKSIEKFTDMIYSSGAHMPIKKPTRVPIHTEKCCVGRNNLNNKKKKKCKLGKGTLIDHLYSNNLESIKIVGINVNDMSDHYPIFFIMRSKVTRFDKSESKLRRDYKNFDPENFCRDIKNLTDRTITNETTIDQKFEYLHDAILGAMNKNAPTRDFYKKELNAGYKPWFTKEFTDRINEKNHLRFLLQKKNSTELTNHYVTYSKNLKNDLRNAEKNYYDSEFSKHKTDMKETWKLINNVMNKRKKKVILIKKMKCENGAIVTDQEQICNILNKHFVMNGPKLARKIPNTNIMAEDFLTNQAITETIFLSPTDEEEIEKIIDNLKSGKACGPDGINASFIKHGKNVIATILKNLINECLLTGFFPKCLKRALVVPIHKSGAKDSPDNYRPISLLPCISKIFEKVVYKRIIDFCIAKNVLSKKQFGFRKKHSTQHALNHLTDFLLEKLDNSETSLAVFLDLSKAFETVNHNILLKKLRYYGIRGVAYDLIQSYLSDRKQCVKSGPHFSVFMDVECGVPQGSILGPLVFLLYVDLPFAVDLYSILFADDTCILSSSNCVNTLIRDINMKLNRLNDWFISNKLTVNYTKTNYIVFSGNNRKRFDGEIKMGENTLQRVTSTKYLGIMFDENLNWKSHVSYLCSKITKCCNIMYKLRYLVPLESCISVYNSLFYSRVIYGVTCWGNASNDVINPIRVLQNKVVKTMLCKPFNTRIQSLLSELQILNIKDLFYIEIAKHVHKFYNLLLPEVFNNQFSFVTGTTRSSSRNDLVVKRTKKEIGKRSSSIIGAVIWNSIPNEIRELQFKGFCKAYKSLLITAYT